ncbi:MAG: class I SAM-dependent methyltransferase [Planctomycetota bacterium]
MTPRQALRHYWKVFRLAVTGKMPKIDRRALTPSPGDPLYVGQDHSGGCSYAYPEGPDGDDRLVSCLCTEDQLRSPTFRYWIGQTKAAFAMHRKQWEFGYVMQALHERGCLDTGKRGLGFAVGKEPMPKVFASRGCEIVATDLHEEDERSQVWRKTGQHMSKIASAGQKVNESDGSITYRHVDMNRIPDDLTGFDFTWSTCSFEHCGSIRLGQEFIWNQMRCLKPGGTAVHTTEFNLSSNTSTLKEGATVIFRRTDIEEIVRGLVAEGHHVEPLSLDPGTGEFDEHIDWPPYSSDKHLRLMLKRYAATSIGLIIRKAESAALAKSA